MRTSLITYPFLFPPTKANIETTNSKPRIVDVATTNSTFLTFQPVTNGPISPPAIHATPRLPKNCPKNSLCLNVSSTFHHTSDMRQFVNAILKRAMLFTRLN